MKIKNIWNHHQAWIPKMMVSNMYLLSNMAILDIYVRFISGRYSPPWKLTWLAGKFQPWMKMYLGIRKKRWFSSNRHFNILGEVFPNVYLPNQKFYLVPTLPEWDFRGFTLQFVFVSGVSLKTTQTRHCYRGNPSKLPYFCTVCYLK